MEFDGLFAENCLNKSTVHYSNVLQGGRILEDKQIYFKSYLFTIKKRCLLAELNLHLPLPDVDDQLLVLVKQVYFKWEESKGFSVVKNIRYIGAQIMSIVQIKEGALVSFKPKEKAIASCQKEKQECG